MAGRVNVRFDEHTLRRVQEQAAAEGRTISEVIRAAVAAYDPENKANEAAALMSRLDIRETEIGSHKRLQIRLKDRKIPTAPGFWWVAVSRYYWMNAPRDLTVVPARLFVDTNDGLLRAYTDTRSWVVGGPADVAEYIQEIYPPESELIDIFRRLEDHAP